MAATVCICLSTLSYNLALNTTFEENMFKYCGVNNEGPDYK